MLIICTASLKGNSTILHGIELTLATTRSSHLLHLSLSFLLSFLAMAGGDNPPPITAAHPYHPALTVTNIRSLVSLVLDMNKVQYSPWATLFRTHAKVFNVLDHIDPKVPHPTDVSDELWERLDATVLQRIYGTISTDLLYKILDENATAMVAWDTLRNIFQNNKGSRIVHLESRFGSIKLAHCSTLDDYCQELKTVADQLAALGHPISEQHLVLQLASKVAPEYHTIATIIQQRSPLPSFEEACSMLDLVRMNRETETKDGSESSSTVLISTGDNPGSQPHHGGSNGCSNGGRNNSGHSGGGRNKHGKKKNWNNNGGNHPRCRDIKLTHLCFANDLILCSKGDFPSIYLLLQAFKLFSITSGLSANIQKSSVYCHGMTESDVNRVIAASGFTRSALPFRYLGVPICSKKITAAQCEMLVDKVTARIKVWSSRNLSYTARMQLINAVLLSIHMYWSQIYILPKSVLKEITKICRSFLWSGQAYSSKPSYIAWEQTCCDKNQGGLGFRNVEVWNVANLGKYVWAVANKQDNIWIKWINSVYVKDGDWWDFVPTSSSSWYWKKICDTKEQIKQVFTATEFCNMPKYSVKLVYNKLIDAKPMVHWDKMVWNRLTVPKHRFISWLAIQHRLQTTAKMARIGVSSTSDCLLCGQAPEDHEHLFFKCPYSSRCLTDLKNWLGIQSSFTTSQRGVRQLSNSSNSKFRKSVMYASMVALTYLIWRSRNSSFWDKSFPTVLNVMTVLKQTVKSRVMAVMPKNVSRKDSLWFQNL
ncbi:uncharacterized protein [Spinacia oleracea]|uniref:Reverse transcriptase zinc-binding domain-containing protein n=1 Tax=Spinacia oleracea TaxID=3562 RepID=A0ABM3R4P6_SPIOL|nr:uncharacterized protein LOC130465756 [Spinacia oleracea]